jgi:hypothetical protein
MSAVTDWFAVSLSSIALANTLRSDVATRVRRKRTAVDRVLDHWESGSRLRNMTPKSDPNVPGVKESVKAWRGVCQASIEVVRTGREHDLIRQAQRQALPVESILDIMVASGQGMSGAFGPALDEMQAATERLMRSLAETVERHLEPRERELW